MAAIRLSAPATARPGEVIELKALIQHPMESGFRPDGRGQAIPRDIITRFDCEYDGAVVFSATFYPAIAANPLLTFTTRATRSGPITFRWTDQNGTVWSETATLTVA